ncbi:MAG: hypothetical protein KGK33_11275 [Hyphomicrobiales bacterium]|nr:hypothetical protein [Hyphomicrobiales bacterium]MDE1973257.1 hypothetical protein [Hyphomicrobiales bacterium]MDE2285187.1 hypothetical protein [Hyphomicrobiales bacterium]MDE2373432.1 hypothetical protein [Hyphomicrobiales bacterium]
MRRLTVHLAAALALALTAVAAQAQVSSQQSQINAASRLGQSASRDMEDKGKSVAPKANDKAYNAALKNLPDKQYDPWRGVR